MGRRDAWTEFVKGQTVSAKVGTSKYHAERTTVDGITFDSKKEAARYSELKLLEKAGVIRTLVLQPEFSLNAWGMDHAECALVGHYRGDFSYEEFKWPGDSKECRTVVEDVKGVDTPLSKWKRKHLKAQYGIAVRIL